EYKSEFSREVVKKCSVVTFSANQIQDFISGLYTPFHYVP
ncbi:33169_t:CDS:2, partial [Racocetra persica]